MDPCFKFRKKSYIVFIFLFSLFWKLNIHTVSLHLNCSYSFSAVD